MQQTLESRIAGLFSMSENMRKTCQPLEFLDAVYGAARSGGDGLEPGLDWGLGVGTVLVYAGKVWFLDRMVWLYEDMKDSTT